MITIGVIPPKRPFAYTQILTYVDGQQTLGATIKFGTFTEPFLHCTIGMASSQNIRRFSNNGTKDTDSRLLTSSSIDSAAGSGSSKGMLPSLIERSFFSQVESYFSLPLRNTSSNDPNVKTYPVIYNLLQSIPQNSLLQIN